MTLWYWNHNKPPASKEYEIKVRHAFYDGMNTSFKGKTFDDILSYYDSFLVVNYKIDNTNKKIVVYIASLTQIKERITALKCRYFDLLESNGELKKIATEIQSLTDAVKNSEKEGYDY